MDEGVNAALLLCFLLLPTGPGSAAHGKYFHILKTCVFAQTGSRCDVLYNIRYQFDGRLQALYNSSTEEVVGFTEYGRMFADEVNKNPDFLRVRRHDLDYYCKVQAALVYRDIQDRAVPPVSRLKRVKSNETGDSEVLVCSAYNFYPQHIRLTWLRDGVVVPDPPGMVLTEMPGGAWRYQGHSYFKGSSSGSGEDISCMVEHKGLQEPQVLKLERSQLLLRLEVGGSVLALGLLVLLVSTSVCYTRTRGAESSDTSSSCPASFCLNVVRT